MQWAKAGQSLPRWLEGLGLGTSLLADPLCYYIARLLVGSVTEAEIDWSDRFFRGLIAMSIGLSKLLGEGYLLTEQGRKRTLLPFLRWKGLIAIPLSLPLGIYLYFFSIAEWHLMLFIILYDGLLFCFLLPAAGQQITVLIFIFMVSLFVLIANNK